MIQKNDISLSNIHNKSAEIHLNIKNRSGVVSKKRTLIHIEVLRIICCYLVMFNHTATDGFFLFSVVPQSKLYWLYMFITIVCKVNVPVFFMITGALLLSKDESIKTIYSKRVFKFIIILVVISAVYYLYDWKYNNGILSLAGYLKLMYSSQASVALWYLYGHIGILTMLPFLRKMVRTMTTKDYLYLAVGHVVIVGIIPIVQYYLSGGTLYLNGHFSATIFTTSNIFFVLMGHFAEKVLKETYYNWKNALAFIGLSILCIMITCFMTQFSSGIMGELTELNSQIFFNSLIAIPTFTLYYCSKLLFERIKVNIKIQKCIQFIGGTTFGIYLLERIIRERLHFVFLYLKPVIHTMPASLIYIFVCLIVGIIVVALLKKVPIIKKLF